MLEVPNLRAALREIILRKSVLVTGFLLFLAFTGLYILLSPGLASQPWDSLAYAYAAEDKGIDAIWGNHPLGHLLFSIIFSLAKGLGYQGRALTIFATTNSILGGLIIAVFFASLVFIIKVRVIYAMGFSLILGASYNFWFFAGTGDIYHVAILFSLLAWAALAYEITVQDRRYPWLSGFLVGLSLLFHQLNIVLVPANLALILFAPRTENRAMSIKVEKISLFTVTALAVAGLGYLLIGFIATSSFSLTRIIGWMRGYFGDPTYGRHLTLEVFETAGKSISQALIVFPKNQIEVLPQSLVAFLLIIPLFGLFAQRALDGRKRAILKATALQCLITGLLIVWWEPQNSKFWLLIISPFMIALALSFEAVTISLRRQFSVIGERFVYAVQVMPLLFGVLTLVMNIQHIDGNQDPAAFQESLNLWLDHSGPSDILITAGDMVPQLRYWGKRPNTVFLYRYLQAGQSSLDKFSYLRANFTQALCAHRLILIAPAASESVTDRELSLVGVNREELRSFLEENARKGEIVFWYRSLYGGKRLPVYALRGTLACSSQNAHRK